MYRTSIFSEQKEIISSGTVISFNNEPITLKLFEDTTNVVTLKFVFKNNPEEKKEALSGKVINDTLVLTLTNFNNPIGSGTTKPMDFASYKGQNLYLPFRVTILYDSDRTLYYTIYKEEKPHG